MKKYRYSLNLQLFAEDAVDTGVEAAPAAEVQEGTEVSDTQTGVESQAAAEPEKQNNFEKAFAKRLAAERDKWQNEVSEKYKDYDTLREVSEYFVEVNKERGINDVLSLKEQIELERLQSRAEKENVPPEVLKRLDELEAKAAKVDEFEQQQQQAQQYQEFRLKLDAFAKEKGADANALHAYMHENQIGNMQVAFDAMEAVNLREQLANAEKEGVKKFLQAKGAIPTVPGSPTQGQVTSAPPKTMAEARARAMQRMNGEI